MTSFYWAALAAFVWGIVPIFEKAGLVRVAPMAGLFYRCTGVLLGLIILILFVVKPEEIRSVDMRSAFLLVAGGFLASFIAQIFFYNALKGGSVSTVVPLSGSYPLIAFILGVLLLGESFSIPKLIGMLLVVAGIWFLRLG